MDLGDLTLEYARPLIGATFTLVLPDGRTLMMKLEDALPFEVHRRRSSRTAPKTKRDPFSLYFTGPLPVLPQGMYTLRADALTLESVFIVPLSADDELAEYEAIFS